MIITLQKFLELHLDLGASFAEYYSVNSDSMKDIPAPDCVMLDRVRAEAGQYLEVFRHCKHCRADALGIPGKGKDLHSELYKDREEEAVETFSHG